MSPRTADQNAALRAATRARILPAALRVFSRRGYAGATLRAIAREAGMAPGLIYSHFEGKRDLLAALFARGMQEVRATFAAAAAPGREAPLLRLARSACTLLRRDPDFWRLSYGLRMQEEAARLLGPDFRSWTREILGTLEVQLRAAGSPRPKLDAALFFAAFDGLCQHFVLDPGHYPLEAVSEALVDRLAPRRRHPKKKEKRHDRARSRSRRS